MFKLCFIHIYFIVFLPGEKQKEKAHGYKQTNKRTHNDIIDVYITLS